MDFNFIKNSPNSATGKCMTLTVLMSDVKSNQNWRTSLCAQMEQYVVVLDLVLGSKRR